MPASKTKARKQPTARDEIAAEAGAVTAIIPKRLAKLAEQCQALYKVPVEIQTYGRLKENLLKRIREEPVILVAEMEDLSEFTKNHYFTGDGTEYPGKTLLLTNREDLSNIPFATNRGIEVLSNDTPAGLWSYKINKFIEELKYDRNIGHLREEDLKKRKDLDSLNEIGSALSTEKDLNKLLDLIVSRSREMTWADAGTLYLIEADSTIPVDDNEYFKNKKMRFQVAQNDSKNLPFKSILVNISPSSIYGYVALNQEPLNFEDVYYLDPKKPYGWGGKDFDAITDYRTMSMLTVPMANYRGETIGVIQLINRKTDPSIRLEDPETCVQHIQPFTEHDIGIAMSIASQASIAIQNTQLVNSIKGLFDGFIAASVKAIESRDPTTSGHSQRVADLTVALTGQVDRLKKGKFKDVSFSEEMVQEIRYASLLHDFGKIGVREHVLVKAKKLYPYESQAVQDRFEVIRRTVDAEFRQKQIEYLSGGDAGEKQKALVGETEKERQEALAEVEEYLNFIMQCNEPTVLAQGGFERLNEIATKIFRNWEGSQIPYLNERELVSLSVPRGSLNENDRKEIESHVTHTYKFLTTIPWTPNLRRVPEIAYAHHEKLDGTGYPNKLKAQEIPIQAKMMTIADIFDALTASDRPYKKAMPAERALYILQEESKADHVDSDLLELFVGSEIYKIVL